MSKNSNKIPSLGSNYIETIEFSKKDLALGNGTRKSFINKLGTVPPDMIIDELLNSSGLGGIFNGDLDGQKIKMLLENEFGELTNLSGKSTSEAIAGKIWDAYKESSMLLLEEKNISNHKIGRLKNIFNKLLIFTLGVGAGLLVNDFNGEVKNGVLSVNDSIKKEKVIEAKIPEKKIITKKGDNIKIIKKGAISNEELNTTVLSIKNEDTPPAISIADQISNEIKIAHGELNDKKNSSYLELENNIGNALVVKKQLNALYSIENINKIASKITKVDKAEFNEILNNVLKNIDKFSSKDLRVKIKNKDDSRYLDYFDIFKTVFSGDSKEGFVEDSFEKHWKLVLGLRIFHGDKKILLGIPGPSFVDKMKKIKNNK